VQLVFWSTPEIKKPGLQQFKNKKFPKRLYGFLRSHMCGDEKRKYATKPRVCAIVFWNNIFDFFQDNVTFPSQPACKSAKMIAIDI
jgi:hypothetical protein